MKYVMFENEEGHKLPVIFPDSMTHSVMAQYVQHMMLMQEDQAVKPVSAGFVSMKAHCSGKSETLNLSSSKDDSLYVTFNDSIRTAPLEFLPPNVIETLKEGMKDE